MRRISIDRRWLFALLLAAACGRRTFPVGEETGGGGGGNGGGGGGQTGEVGPASCPDTQPVCPDGCEHTCECVSGAWSCTLCECLSLDAGSPEGDAASDAATACDLPSAAMLGFSAGGWSGRVPGVYVSMVWDGGLLLELAADATEFFGWAGPPLGTVFAVGDSVTMVQSGHWDIVLGSKGMAAAYHEDGTGLLSSQPEPLDLGAVDLNPPSLAYSLQCSDPNTCGNRLFALLVDVMWHGGKTSAIAKAGETAIAAGWQVTNVGISGRCSPADFAPSHSSQITVLGPPPIESCRLDEVRSSCSEGTCVVACSNTHGLCQPPNRGGPCGGFGGAGCDPGFTCLLFDNGCSDAQGLCLTDAERAGVCAGPLADQFACP